MLTQEQQKLAEQYHGLIFSFAKEMRLSFEEWYGVLAIALCKAAAFYDPSKGYCFMTTAYLFMRRAVYHEWRKTRLQRYIPDSEIDSYNVVVIGPHGNPTEKIELLDSQMRNQKFDYTEIEVDEFRHQLTDLHRTVLDGLMAGKNGSEIAKELGYTKGGISFIRQKLKKQWRDFCAA